MDDIYLLTNEEADLAYELSQIIQAQILQNGGVISFSRYMELALYNVPYGYYNNGREKFGRYGDFITAPIYSELFANCLARQVLELFEQGVEPNILEFGAGNGNLALDLLKNINNSINKYYILELSATAIKKQKELITASDANLLYKVVWLDKLPQEFDGVIIANEVLDAQPCELICYDENSHVYQLGVSYKDDKFVLVKLDQIHKNIEPIIEELNLNYTNYTTEVHPANAAFIKTLANVLHKGTILLIDYGYSQNEYYMPSRSQGTLRGFFRHHVLDGVLIYPGLIDITTSVNFSQVVKSMENTNLELIGYTTFANFLINCGIVEVSGIQRVDQNNSKAVLKMTNAINYLTSPNEMGEVFKVMALSKNIEFANYMGFSHQDRSYTL